jgi:hypothetical protein
VVAVARKYWSRLEKAQQRNLEKKMQTVWAKLMFKIPASHFVFANIEEIVGLVYL